MRYITIFVFCIFALVVQAKVRTYNFPVEVRKSDKYEVTVVQNGKSQTSFVHFSQCPEMNNLNEKILPMLVDRTMSWTNFSFSDGALEIIVKKLNGSVLRDLQITPKRYGARINWIDGQSTFRVFPNSTNSLITIEQSEIFDYIEIYSLYGRMCHASPVSNTKLKIDLSFLENGMYILKNKTSRRFG